MLFKSNANGGGQGPSASPLNPPLTLTYLTHNYNTTRINTLSMYLEIINL